MTLKSKHGHDVKSEAVIKVNEFARASVEKSTNALLSGDADAIAKEFSVTFTASGGDWRFADRDDLVKRVGSGLVKYDYIRTEVDRVDVPNEHVAIVTGTRSVKAVVDGKDFASTFPFKAIHGLEDGHWRVLVWAVNA